MKALFFVALLGFFLAPLGATEPPNFVFILIDDMPWHGTSVRMDPDLPGSATPSLVTPNLEKLAKQGMTFRNARAAAGMCAPSRCSILTGMMTAHHLFSGNGGFGSSTNGTPEYFTEGEEPTAPLLVPESQGNIRFPSTGDVLRSAGYATAHFGKWHIYGGGPAQHGFDESDGETTNSQGNPRDPVTGKSTYTCDDPKQMFGITRRSLDFIERAAKAGKPFFVQLSHYATHAGCQARPETLKKYEKNTAPDRQNGSRKDRQSAGVAEAMTEDLDSSIGQLLSKLEQLNLDKNTYIFFTADNGFGRWNQNLLRGNKWWLWEMGIRVPLIIRGPGIAAGSRSAMNVVGYDFLPTIADLAGATSKLSKQVDGQSFAGLLLGKTPEAAQLKRPLYFHYPHYRVSAPCSAIITGEMKLLHFYEWPDKNFIYDLATDLGEKKDLSQKAPEQTKELHEQLMRKLKEVGAYLPKPNPEAAPNPNRYDPNSFSDSRRGHDPEAGESSKPPGKRTSERARKKAAQE